jgi:hypothetical protein
MASTVDELTVNYEEEGVLVVKELDKQVLSKGTWSTIIYKYQQWNNTKQAYGAEAFTIRRYRKMNDEYRQQAKFNISSRDQAQKIIEALQKWLKEAPLAPAASDKGDND